VITMARHDYDLPPGWHSLTDEQKDRWYKGERARRQALRQDTPLARKAREVQRRRERRAEARPGTVSVRAHR